MRQKVHELLNWYVEMGISVATASKPCNHFEFIPTKVPLAPPAKKNTLRPITASVSPIQSITSAAQTSETVLTPVPKGKVSEISIKTAAACKTLEDLRTALEQFEDCTLKLTATNTVFSDGNPKAKIMLIGEAPGADEDRQGIPFVGTCGQLLNNALHTIGLDRTNIYIANIVPWRPPGNRPPTAQEIALCLPFIKRHIELIQPELLILLGGVATKSLLNSPEGIMKLRGNWSTYSSDELKKPVRAIATYHPAFLLRSPSQKAQVWKDLLLIQEELERLS